MMTDKSSPSPEPSETPASAEAVSPPTLPTGNYPPLMETTPPIAAGAETPPIVAADTVAESVRRIGRYPIFGEVGHGGMGNVFRGRDPELGRELAIKVLRDEHQLHPDMVRRFLDEARIGGGLQHPGVVPVYELGQAAAEGAETPRPYFTMKLIEGRTLAVLLDERRAADQDLPRFLKIFEQVCQTLAYAHARGVLHRDLKPANIMVGAFGEVQVMDWGLAKVLRRSADAPLGAAESVVRAEDGSFTQAGAIMGTPGYMPPEQARAEPLDERGDVFSLGAILCEILTGGPPYAGSDARKILVQAQRGDLTEAFVRLDDCGADAELVRLTRDCLAPRPANRPPHARVVAERMTAYLAAVQERLRAAELERAAALARAEEARAKAAAERRARRLTGTLASVILLAILAGAAGVLAFQLDRSARSAREMARQAEETRKEVETIQSISHNLEQARTELDLDHHGAALAAARKAEGLLTAGGESLRTRVEEMLADLAMIARLEVIRRQTVELLPDQSGFDPRLLSPRYRQAFADYGIPILDLETEDAAEKIRRRAIRPQLLAALDHWAAFAPDAATRRRLLAIAQAADPQADGVMAVLRQAMWEEDSRTFKQTLLTDGRVKDLPPLTLFVFGSSLLATGNASEAVRLLEGALARRPQDFWLNYQLGVALAQSRPPRDADSARYCTAALALRPDVPSVWVNLGAVLARQGRLAEAIDACNRALNLRPDYAPAHYSLGLARLREGDLARGRESLEEALRLQPDFAAAHYALGNFLARQRMPSEAQKHLRETIRLKPDHADAHNDLGNLLALRGQTDEAIRSYRQALKHAPEDAKIWKNLGEIQGRMGRSRESEEALETALRLKPDYAEAIGDLGFLRLQQNRLEDAERLLHKALTLQPNLIRAYGNLAEVLRRRGKREELVTVYRKLVELQPSAETWSALGGALLDQGDDTEAAAACRKAIALKPAFPDPHVNLGLALLRQGEFDAAKKHLSDGEKLLDRRDTRRGAVQGWVSDCKKMSRLASKLPAILKGEAHPADNDERLLLAGYCQQSRHLYAAAARLYVKAFAADAKLADDLQVGLRYQASCAAVLAASGHGEDDPKLDDKERTRWRKQALDWLRADLALWGKVQKGGSSERVRASVALRHWQRDADLAAVRESAALVWLPVDERRAWDKLWAEVAELLKKSGS